MHVAHFPRSRSNSNARDLMEQVIRPLEGDQQHSHPGGSCLLDPLRIDRRSGWGLLYLLESSFLHHAERLHGPESLIREFRDYFAEAFAPVPRESWFFSSPFNAAACTDWDRQPWPFVAHRECLPEKH